MAKPIGRGGIDSPDFIQSTTPHENPVEITLAELAIRLGFPHVFERTGNVLYYDTFQYGISGWNARGSEAGNIPKLATRGLLASPYSVALINEDGASGWSYINKRLAYPYLTTYGLEMAFFVDSEFDMLDFAIELYTGEYRYYVWARYWDTTHTIYIYDDTPGWVAIGTYDVGAAFNAVWHPIKLVGDIVNENYVRLVLDSQDISLADYGIAKSVNTTAAHINIRIDSTRDAARVNTIYIDNVIMTINEPS